MLIGISPLLSPDLLAALYRMGHGDDIVLADAHYPGESLNMSAIRADGIKIPDLLDAILPMFALDTYVENPVIMMTPTPGDVPDPTVEETYRKVILKHWPDTPPIARIERYEFYDRSKAAFTVVMTGDTVKYGNIILKKGVSPV